MHSDPLADLEWDCCAELKLGCGWGWCLAPGVAQSNASGTDEHYKHVARDSRVAECFEFQVGSTARSIVEASTTLGYGHPG